MTKPYSVSRLQGNLYLDLVATLSPDKLLQMFSSLPSWRDQPRKAVGREKEMEKPTNMEKAVSKRDARTQRPSSEAGHRKAQSGSKSVTPASLIGGMAAVCFFTGWVFVLTFTSYGYPG